MRLFRPHAINLLLKRGRHVSKLVGTALFSEKVREAIAPVSYNQSHVYARGVGTPMHNDYEY